MSQTPIEGASCTVMVRDVERAVRFYTRVLGMRLRTSHSGPAADWAEVDGHGIRIVLLGRDRPSAPEPPVVPIAPPAHVAIVFEVAELERAMPALREQGVEFRSDIAEDAEFRTAYFTDQDGTPLFLRERRR